MAEVMKCEMCGEPMPPDEQMFKYHGYSGDCPKPPLPRPTLPSAVEWRETLNLLGSQREVSIPLAVEYAMGLLADGHASVNRK